MLEINHNKTITKKLASAVHYQQVGHESVWQIPASELAEQIVPPRWRPPRGCQRQISG